jgi:L-ascorbate metabolism protein UlaG (beta-lactamase superfamily)
MLLARSRNTLKGLSSLQVLKQRTVMTATESRVKIEPSSYPLVPPSFYTGTPHHISKGFRSPWPSADNHGGMLSFFKTRLFEWDEKPLPSADALPAVRPATFIPTNTSNQQSSVKYTWLGHAACHFQLPTSTAKSITILTDPVFAQRCSPSQTIGPKRYTAPPTNIKDMADSKDDGVWPDLLVLSHNHYDHACWNTLQQLLASPNGKPRPHIFCPLGMGQWFKYNFDVKEDGLTELDWWQDRVATIKGDRRVKVTCVPAQHFSGRGLFDRNATLWAGWTFQALGEDESKGKSIYFAGDSGYRTVPRGTTKEEEENLPHCPAFQEIGEKLGPFDVAAIPIGAYNVSYLCIPLAYTCPLIPHNC